MPKLIHVGLLAIAVALLVSAGQIAASSARLASVEVVHIDTTTVLRLTANGPIAWRESSGLSANGPLGSPLHLKIYGVTLANTARGAIQETSTELGKLQLQQDAGDDLLLTLTASDSRSYRVRSGRSANVLEILSR